MVYRHGGSDCAADETVIPCGFGSTAGGSGGPTFNVATCDPTTWINDIYAQNSPTTFCLPYYAQPVRTSFFSDLSAFSFFDDVGPPVFIPATTMFYGLSLFEGLDPGGAFLFGRPTYDVLGDPGGRLVADPTRLFRYLRQSPPGFARIPWCSPRGSPSLRSLSHGVPRAVPHAQTS